MRGEEVEAQVAVMLSRVQLPDRFKKVLDAYFQYFAKERLDQEDKERKSLKQELIRIQQQIRNIVVDRSKRIIDAEVFIKIQDELLREKEKYQGRLGEMEGKSDKFVQKFNELLDFTDHADRVFQTSGFHQKRTLMKLCFDGFVVRNQKLTPIWTPVFDVLIDLQVAKIEPPEPPRGSKHVANTKVQTWKSGGEGEIRTHGPVSRTPVFKTGALDRSATSPFLTPAVMSLSQSLENYESGGTK